MRTALSDAPTLVALIAVMGALWAAWVIEAELRKRYNWRPPGLPPRMVESLKTNVKRRAIWLTILCAVLLGGGSCYGYLNTFTMAGAPSFWNNVFAWGFLLCVVIFFVALLLGAAKEVLDWFRKE